MGVIKQNITDFMLYAGRTKHEYSHARPAIHRVNQRLWRVGSIVGLIIFTILLIYAILRKEGPFYYIMFGVMIGISIATIILMLLLRADSILQQSLMYVFASLIMAYGIYIGNSRLNTSAVTTMVMLIVIPIAILDRPWKIITLIILSIIGEIITLSIIKINSQFYSTDLINTIVFGIISIVMSSYISCLRVRSVINEEMLKAQAHYDQLTGLGNELAYLEERTSLDLEIMNNPDLEFTIAMFDVNCVKNTNDTYGHQFGCALIVETGHYLRTIFGDSNLYHVGGDEFIAIIRKEDLKSLDIIFQKFDSDMEEYYITKNGIKIRLTCARGYTAYNPKTDICFEDVLHRADELMYENKSFIKKMYDLPER